MRKHNIIFVLFLLFALSISVSAHPGRTDSNGGHYNRDTGEYHYHNGEYAGQNQDNDTYTYSYSEFAGPTFSYDYGSNNLEFPSTEKNTTTKNADKVNNSDKETGIGILIALFGGMFAVTILGGILLGLGKSKETVIYSPPPKPEDDNLKFLKPAYAERIKKLQNLEHNTSDTFKKQAEQIAGFPEGFYINCFTVNDLKSNEPFGRATAYINKKDNVVHLKYNCDNATTPINMLFDVYEMKNYKLCDKCCSGEKLTFYGNYEKWYKAYMKLQSSIEGKQDERF